MEKTSSLLFQLSDFFNSIFRKRISPLPSDDWDGISEELWCCRSKDVAGVPPDLKMSPNREECLSGNFEYILSIPQFLEQSVVFCDKDSARSGKKVVSGNGNIVTMY